MAVNNHLKRFPMNLTPGQLQVVLGLSRATFRHWKESLPPLAGRNGYRPCFSLGDLFAMALIRALTEDAGVRVGVLHTVATSLFEQCGRQSWAALERSVLVLELARVRVEFVAEPHIPHLDRIGIVVPCRPIIADLRERLLKGVEDVDQGNLRFPPTMVRGGA
jgi:hypothetical protein